MQAPYSSDLLEVDAAYQTLPVYADLKCTKETDGRLCSDAVFIGCPICGQPLCYNHQDDRCEHHQAPIIQNADHWKPRPATVLSSGIKLRTRKYVPYSFQDSAF
jgi:hypothetical protein